VIVALGVTSGQSGAGVGLAALQPKADSIDDMRCFDFGWWLRGDLNLQSKSLNLLSAIFPESSVVGLKILILNS
jgi:hypothetical protein